MFDTESGQDDSPMLGNRGQQHRLLIQEEAVPSATTPRWGKSLIVGGVLVVVLAGTCMAGLAWHSSRRVSVVPQGIQRAFGVDSPVPGSSLFQDNQALSAAGLPLTTDSTDELMQSAEVPDTATSLTNSDTVPLAEAPVATGSDSLEAPLADEAVATASAPQEGSTGSDEGEATPWTDDASQEAPTAVPALGTDSSNQGWTAQDDAATSAPVDSGASQDAIAPASDSSDTSDTSGSSDGSDAMSESSDLLAASDDLPAPPAEAADSLPDAMPIEDEASGTADAIPTSDGADGQPAEASAPAVPDSTPTVAQDQLAVQSTDGALVPTTPLPECGLIEDEISYPGNDVAQIKDVSSPEECCAKCASHPMCSAWTWGKKRDASFSDVCFLKGSHPRTWLTKIRDADFVSGKPQGKRALPSVWPKPGKSLYCFSLMLPRSYEQQLLQLQFMKSASIFICDEYGIYSNESIEVMPGLSTSVVHSSLSCSVGGEFKTALNTNIFMEVWKKVVSDGRFMFHDWIVKVDPDCVFFPNRLQHILESHSEDNSGTYLNNCWRGLHGPIEVFSKNAIQAWGAFSDLCAQYFNKLCSGPCLWGEDMFIDQCLQKVLKVRRDDEFMLLLEDHCDPIPDWRDCNNQSVAAFHPFKTIDGYWLCVNNAKKR